MATQAPFCFMDLPKELRLMVYERLPRQIKHVRVFPLEFGKAYTGLPKMVLVHKCLAVQVLCASRDVHAEAKKIVPSTVRDFILEAEPKLIQLSKAGTDFESLCLESSTNKRSSLTHKFALMLYHQIKSRFEQQQDLPGILRFLKQTLHILTHNAGNPDFGLMLVPCFEPRRDENHRQFQIKAADMALAHYRILKKVLVKHVGMWAVKPGQSKVLSEDDRPKRFDEDHLIKGPLLYTTIDKETWVGEWLAS